jgi:hypothetical protein
VWTNRVEVAEPVRDSSGAFVAVPMMLVGFPAACLPQPIYQAAFEQARQAMLARQKPSLPDLFTIMN